MNIFFKNVIYFNLYYKPALETRISITSLGGMILYVKKKKKLNDMKLEGKLLCKKQRVRRREREGNKENRIA